jgi:hypothetical protein
VGVDTLEQRRIRNESSIVRIKDGVSLPQAQAELTAIVDRLKKEYPAEEDGLVFKLVPLASPVNFSVGQLTDF